MVSLRLALRIAIVRKPTVSNDVSLAGQYHDLSRGSDGGAQHIL